MTCKAQQQSDEMFCATCGLRWDMNDPDPPHCPNKHLVRGMVKYEVKVKRTIIKTITFTCENDPLLNKMEIAGECADQCSWDNFDYASNEVTDIRKVEL